jgi:probable phosphoglycerate mutase
VTALVVLRHGPTAWTESGRIQGHTDVPLSPAGRAEVMRWRVPATFGGYDWLSSPLARAVETARLLGADPAIDRRLTEMGWGAWEGRSRAERAETAAGAASGLDARAPGGESPREVQRRLQSLLAERAELGRPIIAVCHKGVIRALYALATGWDMITRPPDALHDACCHHFRLTAAGMPEVVRLNIALVPPPEKAP